MFCRAHVFHWGCWYWNVFCCSPTTVLQVNVHNRWHLAVIQPHKFDYSHCKKIVVWIPTVIFPQSTLTWAPEGKLCEKKEKKFIFTLVQFLMFLGSYYITAHTAFLYVIHNFCCDQLKNDTPKSKQHHAPELCYWCAGHFWGCHFFCVLVVVTLKPIRSYSQAGTLQPQWAGGV